MHYYLPYKWDASYLTVDEILEVISVLPILKHLFTRLELSRHSKFMKLSKPPETQSTE